MSATFGRLESVLESVEERRFVTEKFETLERENSDAVRKINKQKLTVYGSRGQAILWVTSSGVPPFSSLRRRRTWPGGQVRLRRRLAFFRRVFVWARARNVCSLTVLAGKGKAFFAVPRLQVLPILALSFIPNLHKLFEFHMQRSPILMIREWGKLNTFFKFNIKLTRFWCKPVAAWLSRALKTFCTLHLWRLWLLDRPWQI